MLDRPHQEGRKRFPAKPLALCLQKTPQQQNLRHKHPRAGLMKRREFLKVTGIGAAGAATLAAPAIAQSAPELKWRLTASWPKSLDTLWGAVELFAKIVGEATDNKFQIQAFAGGEIVP